MSRKATEVLASIEQQNKEILGHIRNQDMLIKVLVNKINDLESKLGNQSAVPAPAQPTQNFPRHSGDVQQKPVVNAQLPGLKPGIKIQQTQPQPSQAQPAQGPQPTPAQQMRMQGQGYNFPQFEQSKKLVRESVEQEASDQTLELETQPRGKRRGVRNVAEEGVKTVQQRVLYPDGKSVQSAKVEIFVLENGQTPVLVENKKTNAAGKWSGQLPPGTYAVKVFKKGTSKRPTVEAQELVTVPNSDDPVINLKPIQS